MLKKLIRRLKLQLTLELHPYRIGAERRRAYKLTVRSRSNRETTIYCCPGNVRRHSIWEYRQGTRMGREFPIWWHSDHFIQLVRWLLRGAKPSYPEDEEETEHREWHLWHLALIWEFVGAGRSGNPDYWHASVEWSGRQLLYQFTV